MASFGVKAVAESSYFIATQETFAVKLNWKEWEWFFFCYLSGILSRHILAKASQLWKTEKKLIGCDCRGSNPNMSEWFHDKSANICLASVVTFLSAGATTRPPELHLVVGLDNMDTIFPPLAANVAIQTHTCCSASALLCPYFDWRNLAATIKTNKQTHKKIKLWKDKAHKMMMRSYNQTIHERLNNHLQDRTE